MELDLLFWTIYFVIAAGVAAWLTSAILRSERGVEIRRQNKLAELLMATAAIALIWPLAIGYAMAGHLRDRFGRR